MRLRIAALVVLLAAAAHAADTLTVFAAASLTDALNSIAADYQGGGGGQVVFSFAGSSLLARQIEEGAPADLFFSADDALMDELVRRGLIDKGSRREILSNRLVVVVPKNSALRLSSADELVKAMVGRLALADPSVVPAGVYARQYFERKHLWDIVQPKVIPTANVRAALAAVASGNVDAGIVYKTDAAISKEVRVECEIPPGEGPNIAYPAAIVTATEHSAEARQFLNYLESPAASTVFRRFGFIVRAHPP
jgi:molybdate transport system substrate-binding protein